MAQWIKNLPVMQVMQAVQVQSLGWEDITVNFAFRIAFDVFHRFGLFSNQGISGSISVEA